MSAIGPGDYVECVDATSRNGLDVRGIVEGRVYVVTAVVRGQLCGFSATGLLLGGLDPFPCAGWDPSRFRPIYRPDHGLIARLLTDVPADASAAVPA